LLLLLLLLGLWHELWAAAFCGCDDVCTVVPTRDVDVFQSIRKYIQYILIHMHKYNLLVFFCINFCVFFFDVLVLVEGI